MVSWEAGNYGHKEESKGTNRCLYQKFLESSKKGKSGRGKQKILLVFDFIHVGTALLLTVTQRLLNTFPDVYVWGRRFNVSVNGNVNKHTRRGPLCGIKTAELVYVLKHYGVGDLPGLLSMMRFSMWCNEWLHQMVSECGSRTYNRSKGFYTRFSCWRYAMMDWE